MEHNMLIEKMFENRGYTEDFLDNMDKFDSSEVLKDADEMCRRLKGIHDVGRKVVFLPDFDMDGIMSGVIGFAGLSELGFRVSLFIPDPKEGYGFNEATIARLTDENPGADVIITADTGVRCYGGVEEAKRRGFEVIVTDHHMPGERLPSADVVVDPMREDDSYSLPEICGANVIYQCLQYYADTYCDRETQERIRRLRVFAGIGTISDSMPLMYGNRKLVRDAISITKLVYSNGTDFMVNNLTGTEPYKKAFKGLYTVLKLAADARKITTVSDIDESLFGYYLAPMFNSVKRLDQDMRTAFYVFFGSEPESHAEILYQLNEKRKQATEQYLDEILRTDQPYAPLVYLTDAPSGILGLLAQRLMDPTKGPCMVIRKDDYTGSGRSPFWYPFLDNTRDASIYAAGHNAAFGIGFKDQADLEASVQFLTDDVAVARLGVDMGVFSPVPDFVIAHDGTGDTIIDIVLFMEYLDELKRYKPFGSGFPEPNIQIRFRPEDGSWYVIGSAKQHLKIVLQQGFELLLWNQADKIGRKDTDGEITVWGQMELNEYKGKYDMQPRYTVQMVGTME